MINVKEKEMEMYKGKCYGKEVSEYAKEKGYLDYRTLAEIVGDMILCNDITKLFYCGNKDIGWFEVENGTDYDEENECYADIFQYYIISYQGAEFLKKWTNELVYYNENLDIYIWGIDHCGTSWDYVLTNIKLKESK